MELKVHEGRPIIGRRKLRNGPDFMRNIINACKNLD